MSGALSLAPAPVFRRLDVHRGKHEAICSSYIIPPAFILPRHQRKKRLHFTELLSEQRMARRLLPAHVGFIPDGNRRWAVEQGLSKEDGYRFGIERGLALFELCRDRGIPEVSVYGFTQDNTKRPPEQTRAFGSACVEFVAEITQRGAALLVVGNDTSPHFPEELRPFRTRQGEGIKVNFLANYHWEWDLAGLRDGGIIRSKAVSRLDLIVRWGGGRRLSGFLPVQSVYADFYVVEDFWPDYRAEHLDEALDWFRQQDQTLGG